MVSADTCLFMCFLDADLEFMANKPDVTKILAKSVKISEDRLELTVASRHFEPI